VLRAVELVRAGSESRERLRQLIGRFREGGRQLGWTLGMSATPIQPLLVGTSEAATRLSSRLREGGLWVSAIRPPTVPVGAARLRITLCAAHSEQQIDRLLDTLGEAKAHV
jgi:8-amino-7-oxononanoate synthase